MVAFLIFSVDIKELTENKHFFLSVTYIQSRTLKFSSAKLNTPRVFPSPQKNYNKKSKAI